MSKKERAYLLYLYDMLNAMQKIQSFIDDINFTTFKNDEKTQDAVIRNFEIIGEAANQIPANIKSKYPDIPWKEMYGLRNIVSHHYFGVDYKLIWKISTDQLPANKRHLKEVITTEKAAN